MRIVPRQTAAGKAPALYSRGDTATRRSFAAAAGHVLNLDPSAEAVLRAIVPTDLPWPDLAAIFEAAEAIRRRGLPHNPPNVFLQLVQWGRRDELGPDPDRFFRELLQAADRPAPQGVQ